MLDLILAGLVEWENRLSKVIYLINSTSLKLAHALAFLWILCPLKYSKQRLYYFLYEGNT